MQKVGVFFGFCMARIKYAMSKKATKSKTTENKKQVRLTPKKRLFLLEYIKNGNRLTAAAKASGITVQYASKLLNHDEAVIEEMESLRSFLLDSQKINVEWVLQRQRELVERCMQIEKVYDKKGNFIGEYSFNPGAAARALHDLGNHLGMYDRTTRIKLDAPMQVVVNAPLPEGFEYGEIEEAGDTGDVDGHIDDPDSFEDDE